ncbi:MAG: hypothetical protein H6R19_703 [Proteobacteria bacterium]|jgi:hypothetical protein|nr:hypothetical protein [Pseudomonadota bacterium]
MAYVSDFTQFINRWLDQHPIEREEQKKGRALWWDKPQDPAEQQARLASKVPQKPYPYQPE